MIARLVLLLAALLAAAAPSFADEESDRALAALKADGHYGLLRHARAPGRAAPVGARLGPPTTTTSWR